MVQGDTHQVSILPDLREALLTPKGALHDAVVARVGLVQLDVRHSHHDGAAVVGVLTLGQAVGAVELQVVLLRWCG